MPNQRKKGAKPAGAYIDKQLHQEYMEAAKAEGKNLADWVREGLRWKLKRHRQRKKR